MNNLKQEDVKEIKRMIKKANGSIGIIYNLKEGTITLNMNNGSYNDEEWAFNKTYELENCYKQSYKITLSPWNNDIMIDFILNPHHVSLYENAYGDTLFHTTNEYGENSLYSVVQQVIFTNSKGKALNHTHLVSSEDYMYKYRMVQKID